MKVIKLLVFLAAIAIFSLLLANSAKAQVKSNMTAIVDAVIENAKSNALNSRSVNWDSLKTEMHFTAQNAKAVSELRQSFETLLVALNDKHGSFYDPATSSPIAQNPFRVNADLSRQGELNVVKQAEFKYENLDNVHYIRLVAMSSESDVQKQAEVIRQAIDSLSKNESPYWIVDLRYVVGGDMNSLFAGVGPLLGEGLVASTINGKKEINNLYTIHNGNFYHNQVRIGKFPVVITDTHSLKVAVLTSSYTEGAAEILALAFRGRKNSRFFGQSTDGNIGGSKVIPIAANLTMSISETMFTDRKGITYSDNINPDVVIDFIPGADVSHDRAISEALLWLTTTPVADSGQKVTMK